MKKPVKRFVVKYTDGQEYIAYTLNERTADYTRAAVFPDRSAAIAVAKTVGGVVEQFVPPP